MPHRGRERKGPPRIIKTVPAGQFPDGRPAWIAKNPIAPVLGRSVRAAREAARRMFMYHFNISRRNRDR